ncbi:hypothetical protein M9Y10_028459 [Tritrichomonas musculus]|uniref:Uncharacterized protein n=1 Tax=Tritrichomonas musculus TaxID=1915356 RepID=A0ABR2KK54_9EUKA
MISYPISEMAQPMPSSQSHSSYGSVMRPSSLNNFHTNRFDSYKKGKESISCKKQKKSFRTAKFLFPVQLSLATRCQYLPIMPQISNPKVITNMYGPISPNNSYSMQMTPNRQIKTVHNWEHHMNNSCNEDIWNKKPNNSPKTITNDNNEQITDQKNVSSKGTFENSKSSTNFEESTNLNNENEILDLSFHESSEIDKICQINVSNVCFDIVRRGNFPSIMMKDGFVQILQ